MIKNKIIGGVLFGLVIVIGSCSKKLELLPESSISDANYWKSPEQFDAFASGISIALRNNVYALESLGELRADVFGTDPGTNSAFSGEATNGNEHLWNNTIDVSNPGVSNFGDFYFNINQINLFINKLNGTDLLSEADKKYYLGVSHGLRAFYYFQLYKSWGGVIIHTEPTASVDVSNTAKAASSTAEVMQLIGSDIDISLQSFGTDYTFRKQKGFWSKSASLMLKAEVNLWQAHREGGQAAQIALDALNDIQQNVPALDLLPNYKNVFDFDKKGNNEIIFAIHFELNEANLPFASNYYPQPGLIINYYDSIEDRRFNIIDDNYSGGKIQSPVMIATFRKFSDKDTRKYASITAAYNNTNGEYKIAGCFQSKYKGQLDAGSRKLTNDYPIYRYADLLLLKAEAKLLLGQSPEAEINEVRKRAYGSNYEYATFGYPNQPVDSDPVESILEERYREFIMEGKRWYDLRRMGDQYVYKHTKVLPSEPHKLLWPIDRNTLTNNPKLKQTPGYPEF